MNNETLEAINRIQNAAKRKEEGIILSGIKGLNADMIIEIENYCPFIRSVVSDDTRLQIVFDRSAL